jgi:hypothetical protein
MTDPDEMTVYMRQLLRREKAGERATVEIGPYTAMLLIGSDPLGTPARPVRRARPAHVRARLGPAQTDVHR